MINVNLLPLHISNFTSVNPLWESIACNNNRKREREGGGGEREGEKGKERHVYELHTTEKIDSWQLNDIYTNGKQHKI